LAEMSFSFSGTSLKTKYLLYMVIYYLNDSDKSPKTSLQLYA